MFAVIDGAQPPKIDGADFSNTSSVADISTTLPSVNGYSAHAIVFWIKGTWSSTTDETIFGYLDAGTTSKGGWLIRIEDGKLVVVHGANTGTAGDVGDGNSVNITGKRWTSTTRLSDAANYNTSGWNCVFIQINGNTIHHLTSGVQQTTTAHMYVNHTSIGCTATNNLNINQYDDVQKAFRIDNNVSGADYDDVLLQSGNTDSIQIPDDYDKGVTITGAGSGGADYTGVVSNIQTGGTTGVFQVTPNMSTQVNETGNPNCFLEGPDINPTSMVIGSISRTADTFQHFTGSLGPIYMAKDVYADWSDANLRNKWTDAKGDGFHRASLPPAGGIVAVDYDNGATSVSESAFTQVLSSTMITSGTNVTADSTQIRQI